MRWGQWVLRACGLVCALLVATIVGFLVISAWPAIAHIGPDGLLASTSWRPAAGHYGLLAMVAATLALALGAILMGGPLGLASAIFVRFYAPPAIAGVYRRLIELLAGIPSVIYGFWGLVTLVPFLASWRGAGASLLAAVLVLALMILPTVALLSDAALAMVPGDQRRGAAALGMGRWDSLRCVVLPAALPGILRGVLLASLRAAGETMAVLMVAGNVVKLPGDPLAPVRALTANIALEMGYAYGDHQAALFFSGLLLLALVSAGVLVAGGLEQRQLQRTRQPSKARGHD